MFKSASFVLTDLLRPQENSGDLYKLSNSFCQTCELFSKTRVPEHHTLSRGWLNTSLPSLRLVIMPAAVELNTTAGISII